MNGMTTSIQVTEEQVAARAYELWMGRGCPISDGSDDWFAARVELELEAKINALSAAPSETAPATKRIGKPRATRKAPARKSSHATA